MERLSEEKCFEILGIPANSSLDEIKKAYRVKAKLYHPDINQSPEATEKFKEIQQSYEILSGNKFNPVSPFDVFGDVLRRRGVDNLWEQFFNVKFHEQASQRIKIELEFDKLSNAEAEKMLKTIQDAGFDIKRYSIIRGA